jgi:hypothetical protein
MKDQILKLHTLTEAEQIEWLDEQGILKAEMKRCPVDSSHTWWDFESLPELAFRLRDEFMENHSVHCWKVQIEKLLDAEVYAVGTWTASARPIYWIQAALLAKEAIYDQEGEI